VFKMGNKGEVVMGILLILSVVATVFASQTKWNLGYEKSVRVTEAKPWGMSYLSIPGMEDKVYWDRSTPLGQAIYARAKYLADLEGYSGDDIACNNTGTDLLMGIDMNVLNKEKE